VVTANIITGIMMKGKNMGAVLNQTPAYAVHFDRSRGRKRMILVRKTKDGFRCDMCFAKPEYEIAGDDRYNELPAFDLFLCSAHAKQLADSINAAFHSDDFLSEIKNMEEE
jgi:hypothetical protein